MATIKGSSGDDVINNKFEDKFGGMLTKKNDKIEGGKGDDTFVFTKKGGKDTILDFGKGDDTILIRKSKIDSWKEVKKAATQKGDNVEIDLGNGSKIVLKDTKIKDLKKSDFDFG